MYVFRQGLAAKLKQTRFPDNPTTPFQTITAARVRIILFYRLSNFGGALKKVDIHCASSISVGPRQREYWCINGEGWHCHRHGISPSYGNSKDGRKYLIYERQPRVHARIKIFIKIFFMNCVHCARQFAY